MMNKTDAVRTKARELGFEKTGFARAGDAPRGDFLDTWLQREFHGSMEYMAREPAPPRPAVDRPPAIARSPGSS